MIPGADLSSRFALDVQSVDDLKRGARQGSPEALRAAAQQFEAVFMNMLMKSMREASPQDDMLDSEQTRMYTSMLDQQLSQKLATRGIGLADAMVRQLSAAGSAGSLAAAGPVEAPAIAPGGSPLPAASSSGTVPEASALPAETRAIRTPGDAPAHVQAFVQSLLPHAQAASAETGIPAQFMLGQAALETGWGKRAIRGSDGQDSHNLFGIKAGPAWRGRTVDIVTTEYVDGQPVKQLERFRAYDSHADSFRDYANLLRGNARYQTVIAQGHNATGFAQGLQQAGYATDPAYAQKLMGVIRLVQAG
jgi:flagellar protein FlgJ